jgi:Galactose oxidase, central domain
MNLTKWGNLCQLATERSLNASERTGTLGRLLHPMRLCVALVLTFSVPGFSQVIGPPPRPAPSPTWTELDLSFAPSARLAASMAFDPVSGKLILFGGFDGNKFLSDTWTFDGQSWTKVAVAQPPHGRTVAGMAYDAVSKKVVLFGGWMGTAVLGDTWLWDGATMTWTRAHPLHSPLAAAGVLLFRDPNGAVDEFGGWDPHHNPKLYYGDMWQWNGSDWVQLHPPTVPYARAYATVGVNEITNQVVMFGGLTENIDSRNTWVYDGVTWTMQPHQLQPPDVAYGAAMFSQAFNGVVQFGGTAAGISKSSSWLWVGYAWKLLPITGPPLPRWGAASAYDPLLGHAVLFGGAYRGTVLNDTWELTE